ncbi:MAG: beta-ketoacyl-[Oscillospiraceae bacterium]|nr:beta-ketoacyl-[acyl-carrier-protein] synthase family protein [Oscillospiraceae bacterium]
MKERVVITGLGIASICGFGKKDFWNGILSGNSNFTKLTDSFYGEDFSGIYGMLDVTKKNEWERKYLTEEELRLSPCCRIALAAAKEAISDAGLDMKINDVPSERIGVSVGTTHGDLAVIEDLIEENPSADFSCVHNKVNHFEFAASIARYVRASGDVVLHSDACASGNISASYAFQLIRSGRLDRVIVGGADVYSRLTEGGFSCIRALTNDKVKPFDRDRNGIILSEGAAMLVLENYETAKKRGAHIYCEIIGQGQSNDSYHMAAMNPEGSGVIEAMRRSVKDAGIDENDIDYVCLHGTGTVANDACEMKVLSEFLGENVKDLYASSVKGCLGHALGSAAALELAVCSLIFENGIIPPTINVENIDENCKFKLATEPLKINPSLIMNSAYAFGGSNSCVILKKEDGEI